MSKVLTGLTAAAVVAASVAFGARSASADDPSTGPAILSTLLAIEAQLVQIERNTRPVDAGANP